MPDPLVVHALGKDFGKISVLSKVTFSLSRGEILGLLGPNGSGKSTLLHCLTGYHDQSCGEIEFFGHQRDSIAAKDSFGFLPDDLPMPGSLTGAEVLIFHQRLRPRFDTEVALSWANILGLSDHLGKYVGDYSHGMRRKIQLVLALSHSPEVLILDEPLRGLDPEAGLVMRTVMGEFARQGGSVLVATHDLLGAERFCDRVVVLAEGCVIAQGPPQRVVEEVGAPDLEAAFIELTALRDRVSRAQGEVVTMMGTSRTSSPLTSTEVKI